MTTQLPSMSYQERKRHYSSIPLKPAQTAAKRKNEEVRKAENGKDQEKSDARR